eukprot:NODE_430_length_7576_cov_0.738665.p4 type:complete len:177 gc:universal NODE_430_length_7576_cov_0.738665:685-1215(+)
MLDEAPLPSLLMLLTPEDYPKPFRTPDKMYAHPNDYMVTNNIIQPNIFYYRRNQRARLFLRLSIKIENEQYTIATFLLDTGCSTHLYVSDRLNGLLKHRIMMDELGFEYIEMHIHGEKVNCLVNGTGNQHSANVMGLPMLILLGFNLKQLLPSQMKFDDEFVANDIANCHLEHDYL